MSSNDVTHEKYADYEALYDPDERELQEHLRHQRATPHRAKSGYSEIVGTLAEPEGLEAGFQITYQPSRYEEGWLLSALTPFYEQGLISDVLSQVKGGKEACVYCCQATPQIGGGLLAAKVYRPRMFRNLRNDKLYRNGRQVLTDSGRAVNPSDHRTMRALGKKTAFGVQVAHTSWLMHEYTTLQKLYTEGASVPQPVGVGPNAILMRYVGDVRRAAPTLNGVVLATEEARLLFGQVLRHVELMLEQGIVHGDLSAYNILYWEGKISLIDFPQVVDWHTNTQAKQILLRDVARISEYFGRQGIVSDAQAITDSLWDAYVDEEPPIPPVYEEGWEAED